MTSQKRAPHLALLAAPSENSSGEGRLVASMWRPPGCRAKRDGSRTAADNPMNTAQGVPGRSPETLVMMGSGVRVPPSASAASPMNREFRREPGSIGVVARVVLASRLSIPGQRPDSGRHQISAGDRVNSRPQRRPLSQPSEQLGGTARSVLFQPARSVKWPLPKRIEPTPHGSLHALPHMQERGRGRLRAWARLDLVPSGHLDRRRCGACSTHRSESAMDLLPVGIVQQANAFTECCHANAAPMPEVPPAIDAIPWRRAYGRRATRPHPPTTSAAG
jgi:hypothetical protein